MKKSLLVTIFFLIPLTNAFSDYTQEINDQINEVKGRFDQRLTLEYFHDMGIIARKADEADLTNLATEIIRSLLLDKMKSYVASELADIDELYVRDSYTAKKRMQELQGFDRFYKPTDEYQSTTSGQAFSAELIRLRNEALQAANAGCSEIAILKLLQSQRMTGLFITDHAEEIAALRELADKLECCISWAPKMKYSYDEPFETDYEAGTMHEEAVFNLETDRHDYMRAKWTGEWIYKFKGREGSGEGISTAVLTYDRGRDTATLVISAAKLSSVGRMNFPLNLSGDKRDLEIHGNQIVPKAVFSNGTEIQLTGCNPSIEKKKNA